MKFQIKFTRLASKMRGIFIAFATQSVQLDHLSEMYSRQFGYQLRPENHGKTTLVGLMSKLLSFRTKSY